MAIASRRSGGPSIMSLQSYFGGFSAPPRPGHHEACARAVEDEVCGETRGFASVALVCCHGVGTRPWERVCCGGIKVPWLERPAKGSKNI